MRNTHTTLLSYTLPIAALAVGAMMLIPGETPQRAASVQQIPQRSVPSYLAVSPKVIAEINASLAPSVVETPVLEREASRPDPSATPTSRPKLPAAVTVAVTAPEAPEEADPMDDPAKALRVGNVAVNMRSGPSTSNGVIRTLKPGEPLVYGESQGGWVSVTTAAGESGWVYDRYLTGPALGETESRAPERRTAEAKPSAKKQPQKVGDGRYARVGSDVYLRAGPSQSTERMFVLPAGERVQVAERRGNWARVILPSGASGWVRVK